MKILVLGGTADGRHITTRMLESGLLKPGRDEIIYSVAGLVRVPTLPCTVISGGFRQFGGLLAYLQSQQVDLILDVTHPYAAKMSGAAVQAAEATVPMAGDATATKRTAIPCWRFHRPAWQEQPGDNWQRFATWHSMVAETKGHHSLLLTVGQLTQAQLQTLLAARPATHQGRMVIRTAAPPRIELPPWIDWIKAIGPFSVENELALFKRFKVDLLISKNSGGEATEAKLSAARALKVPVFMLDRPPLPKAHAEFDSVERCVEALKAFLETPNLDIGSRHLARKSTNPWEGSGAV